MKESSVSLADHGHCQRDGSGPLVGLSSGEFFFDLPLAAGALHRGISGLAFLTDNLIFPGYRPEPRVAVRCAVWCRAR